MWGEMLLTKEYWLELLNNDFNRGYAAGTLTVLALMVLWLVLHLVIVLLFRTRRCGSVAVPLPDGDLTISSGAIECTARRMLENYPQLPVRKIQLYRRGKLYFIQLYCRFSPGSIGLPELAGKIKPELTALLKETFGIESLREIRIRIEKTEESDSEGKPSESSSDFPDGGTEAHVVYPGF